MPVNFFLGRCKTTSSKPFFGLCDDPPPPHRKAYIDENDIDKWIGLVDNPNLESVDFFAIDNCVDYYKPNGDQEKRCDGILSYSTNLIFVELKDRKSDGWEERGMEQIETTISVFKANYDILIYKVSANVCNKKPYFSSSNINLIQKFKTATGYKISFKSEILIK